MNWIDSISIDETKIPKSKPIECMPTPWMSNELKTNCLQLLGLFILACIIIAGLGYVINVNTIKQQEKAAVVKADPSYIDDDTTYRIKSVAEQYVTNCMKCPTTTSVDVKIIKKDGYNYLVGGFVDSQNSFGAMIRAKFALELDSALGLVDIAIIQ